MLNFAATFLYLVTAGFCFRASLGSPAGAAQGRPDRRFWTVLACAFVVLAAARITGAEEYVRHSMRAGLRSNGDYGERRQWQAPLAAGFITLCAAAGTVVVMRAKRRANRAIVAARWAAGTLGALVVLRLISFHTLDQLLYHGPHLNWVVDTGATAVIAAAAWAFRRQTPVRPAPRGRR